MPQPHASPIDFALPDAEATEVLGAVLARTFPGASTGSARLHLEGDLGAGKTTCVHVDLYRLNGPEEVEELGLRDYLDAGCLLLVEWPSKGATALPPPDIDLALSFADPVDG